MAKTQPRYGRVVNPYGRLQAIVTRYFGPTNTRGARVKATAEGPVGSVMLRWDDALDSYGNHVKACEALIARLGWDGVWYGGAMASGYVFVDTDIPE